MEAKVRRFLGAFWMVALLAAGGAVRAMGQTPASMVWSSDALGLRFAYPSDLVVHEPADAMEDGHLILFGAEADADPQIAAITRCLKPKLLLELPGSDLRPDATAATPDVDRSMQVTIRVAPAATILLAELIVECLTPEQQAKAKDLQAGMAGIVYRLQGMHPMMTPAAYNVGAQMVHVAAAQGQPQAGVADAQSARALRIFTMGFGTSWNNHLLVWYFASNSTPILNRITKSTVQFGKAKPAPLYPVTIGYAAQGPR